jgi:hypothetical protein
MPEVSDEEDLLRFIHHRDYDVKPDGSTKIRSSLFSTSHPVSVNRSSIWPLEQNLKVAPNGWGLCSLTAGKLRNVANPERPPIDIVPDPLDHDPLLGILNPSHANVSRRLTDSESRKAAQAAMRSIYLEPQL